LCGYCWILVHLFTGLGLARVLGGFWRFGTLAKSVVWLAWVLGGFWCFGTLAEVVVWLTRVLGKLRCYSTKILAPTSLHNTKNIYWQKNN